MDELNQLKEYQKDYLDLDLAKMHLHHLLALHRLNLIQCLLFLVAAVDL